MIKMTTDEVIKRTERYLRLMRFKYSNLERLSRLNMLTDYYSSKNEIMYPEKCSTSLECSEQLSSNDFKLPLKVRGVFLTEGRPKKKYYSAKELEKSTKNPINQKFPLMLDHKDTEVGQIVGGVDKIWYDKSLKGIRWEGHINNETFARNVLDGIVTDVSATIFSVSVYDNKNGLMGIDLSFKELSLVMEGAEKKNSIEVVV